MMWILIASASAGVGAGLLFLVYDWIETKREHHIAGAIAEKELTKIFDKAAQDVARLPNPDRTMSKTEVDSEIDRIRARGHDPE